MVTKKKASKAKTKSSSKHKAASKRKVASKKSAKRVAKKVATKKVASKKKVDSKSSSKSKATKSVAKTKASRAKATKQAASTQQATTPCFKVVVNRGTEAKPKLQSIMAKGALRKNFVPNRVTKAPHADLPLTAFASQHDAQRFVDKNSNSRRRRGLKNPWLIIKGEGVQVYPRNFQSRNPQIKSVGNGSSRVSQKIVNEILAVTQTAPPPRRPSRQSNWRNEYPGRNWSRGTIFLSSFRMSKV